MKKQIQRRASVPKPKVVSLIQYVAVNNTPEAKRMIVKFGQVPASSMKELQYKMLYVVRNFGEEALSEISKIHPDRNLIMDFSGGAKMTGEKSNGDYLYNSACGCQAFSGKCDCPKCKEKEQLGFNTNYRANTGEYDADGESSRMAKSNKKAIWATGIVIGSALVLGILMASVENNKFELSRIGN